MTSVSRCGQTTNCAPAEIAMRADTISRQVPAPIMISSQCSYALHKCAITCSACGIVYVISMKCIPPRYTASTMFVTSSSSLPRMTATSLCFFSSASKVVIDTYLYASSEQIRFSTAIRLMALIASCVEAAVCELTITLGSVRSLEFCGGSCSKTSSPSP